MDNFIFMKTYKTKVAVTLLSKCIKVNTPYPNPGVRGVLGCPEQSVSVILEDNE